MRMSVWAGGWSSLQITLTAHLPPWGWGYSITRFREATCRNFCGNHECSHLLFQLFFPISYYCFTLSLFGQFLGHVICLWGRGDSRLHTYWSGEMCDGLPSLCSIMSQSLLLFYIDPPTTHTGTCPLIPQTFRLPNPTGVRTATSQFLQLHCPSANLIITG